MQDADRLEFQSTLPARGATAKSCGTKKSTSNFNPRSPRGERQRPCPPRNSRPRFQSTLPARGATNGPAVEYATKGISIHAPREGSDGLKFCLKKVVLHFNPRSPRGERPVDGVSCTMWELISIHAPREGSDSASGPTMRKTENFNPRSPRGERRWYNDALIGVEAFQSTLPARGATLPSWRP